MYQTSYEAALQDLIDHLVRLPAVGPKGAQRIAYYLLEAEREDVEGLAASLLAVKDKLTVCEVCFNTAQGDRCRICRDDSRDPHVLCVVEEPKDVIAIERTREYTGRYHVLGACWIPCAGSGPSNCTSRTCTAGSPMDRSRRSSSPPTRIPKERRRLPWAASWPPSGCP